MKGRIERKERISVWLERKLGGVGVGIKERERERGDLKGSRKVGQ